MSSGRGSVSAWCIDHPVATLLLTFAIVLLGVIAFPRLPIAPLPEAEFPTIQVTAQLPGASRKPWRRRWRRRWKCNSARYPA